MSQDFRDTSSRASMAPAVADLMKTALTIHSSNPPRNDSQKHCTSPFTITIITLLKGWYSFVLSTGRGVAG